MAQDCAWCPKLAVQVVRLRGGPRLWPYRWREFGQRPHRWVCHRGRSDITPAGSHSVRTCSFSESEVSSVCGCFLSDLGSSFEVFREGNSPRLAPLSSKFCQVQQRALALGWQDLNGVGGRNRCRQ